MSIPPESEPRQLPPERWEALSDFGRSFYEASKVAMAAAGPLPPDLPEKGGPQIWHADGSIATRSTSPLTARNPVSYVRRLNMQLRREAIRAPRSTMRARARSPRRTRRASASRRASRAGPASDGPPPPSPVALAGAGGSK
jgi:hypothetical protein